MLISVLITLINELQKTIKEPTNYRHDWLRHGLCIPFSCPEIPKSLYIVGNDDKTVREAINKCYDKKFSDLGLKGKITQHHCENDQPFYKVDAYDICVG